jgi:hypothetical protein
MNAFFNSVYEWMFGCFSSPKSSEAGIDDSSSTTMSFFHLEGLPDEILLEIFSLLDIRGVLQCGQVSNRLRAISNDKSLWQKVGCDRFLRRTHAPRMFRFQCAPSFYNGRTSQPHAHLFGSKLNFEGTFCKKKPAENMEAIKNIFV